MPETETISATDTKPTIKKRQRVTKTPLSGAQKNTLKREPITIALKLGFYDPENLIRPFPKNFKVEIVYGGNLKIENRKIDDDEGNMVFTVSRKDAEKYKFLRLKFASGDDNYIICEKRGDGAKTGELGDYKKARKKAENGQRFFRLPSNWSLLTSKWTIKTNDKIYDKTEKAKKFLLTEDGKPRGIGTRENPVEATLDPRWQFVKFEFFDRFYGHSDHANKPVSIPPVTVEGFSNSKTGKSAPDTRSNWTIAPSGDEKKIVQCLPWIVQAKSNGTPSPNPRRNSALQFKQPKESFVVSKSATERTIKNVAKSFTKQDKDALKPCADRLKYYDLPEIWKSQKYWCRLSDDGAGEQNFFEKMVKAKTKPDKPLVFSLDDIVLTDKEIVPLAVRETDRLAVFYHEFLDAVSDAAKRGDGGRAGATYSKNGLYKPGPDLAKAKKAASDKAKAAEKSKLEKEAGENAAAAQKTKEENDARAVAETGATTAGKKPDEIKAAGDKAVADVAADAAAQARIKDAGDKAAATVSTDTAAQGKINAAGSDAAKSVADAPEAAKTKAETERKKKEEDAARQDAMAKQKTKEENDARAAAEAAQKKQEEDAARAAAEDKAKKSFASKFNSSLIKKAGDKAVGELAADKDFQARVKAAGDKAVTDSASDAVVQARIKKAGDDAAANVGSDAAAQARIAETGKSALGAATAFPYSDVQRHEEVKNYISDYPHWTRLVIFNGNLFDVFDKRTTGGDVVGARAAVRLVDATVSGIGVAPKAELEPRPPAVPAGAKQDKASLVVQPFYQQQFFARSYNRDAGHYDEWNSPIAANDAEICKMARFEMALLRTSNYETVNEENVVFRYHRLSFDFTAKESLLNPATGAPPDLDDQRTKWITTFANTCADRWNGNDGINTERAWIVEDKMSDPKMKAQIVTFIQSLDQPRAHLHVETVAETGRSWVNLHEGTSEFRVNAGKHDGSRGFAGAHEIGHIGGQPDDYCDDVKGVSGFGSNHVPGTPYIMDSRAMMFYNNQIRARSFWHVTEWLRELNPFAAAKFEVRHNGFSYKVPHYNHSDRPGRNYTHYPVKATVFHEPKDALSFDAYLYFLGEDEYQKNVLPDKPDGILVVMVRSFFKFKGYTDKDEIIEYIFDKLNKKIWEKLNKKRVFAKFSLPGINRGKTETFEKCLLHFSPRFEVDPDLNSLAHWKIKIKTPADAPAAAGLPAAPASSKKYKYRDGATESAKMDLAELYAAISSGKIKPDTQVHDGGKWQAANDNADLKKLFDAYYWYEYSGNYKGPKTFEELYDLARAGTIKWNTNVRGPGWVASKSADKINELLPVLARWFYDLKSGPKNVGPLTEMQIHGKFNDKTLKSKTILRVKPSDTAKAAKDWDEFQAEFKGDVAPRTLDFRFPANPGGSISSLDPAVKHLENVFFDYFCQMLGLSADTTEANSYDEPYAYEDIVKACVGDDALSPKMTRQT